MTTLTPNRIIQQGDEYRNNGTWKPVPKEDYGLQVMFTKYAEVRRASETPFVHVGAPAIKVESQQGSETVTRHAHNVETAGSTPAPAKISPVSEKPKAEKPSAIVTATAEKEKTPAPTPSGAGAPSPRSYPDFAGEFEKAVKAAGLPTVVSVKAHVTETEKAIETAKAMGVTVEALDLRWPKNEHCVWTGRNGCFDGVGMELRNIGTQIAITPRGKRGLGNCTIQFPISTIPEIVDFLLRQQK